MKVCIHKRNWPNATWSLPQLTHNISLRIITYPVLSNRQEKFISGLTHSGNSGLNGRKYMYLFVPLLFTLCDCFPGQGAVTFQLRASNGVLLHVHPNGQHSLSNNHFCSSCHFPPFSVSWRGLHGCERKQSTHSFSHVKKSNFIV